MSSTLRIVPFDKAGSTLKEIAKSKGITKDIISEKSKMGLNTITSVNNNERYSKEQILDYAAAIGIGKPYIVFALDDEDMKRLLNIQP